MAMTAEHEPKTRTLYAKGEPFETDLTDAQAIALLQDVANGRVSGTPVSRLEFAKSLVNSWRHYGSLTERQWPWVHKIVLDERERGNRPAPQAIAIGEFSKIVSLFQTAGESLKRPKIRLEVAGTEIALSIAKPESVNSGQVYVADREYGGAYYGRIDRNGNLHKGRDFDRLPGLVEFLRKLAENPAEVAAEYGRLTGRCCFCGLTLTDERSTLQGYGPICAGKYGLPWGERPGDEQDETDLQLDDLGLPPQSCDGAGE